MSTPLVLADGLNILKVLGCDSRMQRKPLQLTVFDIIGECSLYGGGVAA
jgi:hypothetical protein